MRSESVYYSYSAAQWLLVFYLYCMLGWCFESTVVSVGQRRLVNRGFLRGPMLPIYGFGAVILLHVSLPLKQHPVWLYLASMIAATVFEYIVGVVMEKIFKVKYWDYSKQRFQFQGYICLRSSLCWGLDVYKRTAYDMDNDGNLRCKARHARSQKMCIRDRDSANSQFSIIHS